MSTHRQSAGKRGKELATSYLRKQGYKILERNFRIRNGEIDIIAHDGKTLVFIEVKTRLTSQLGTSLEAINYYKTHPLIRSAEVYKANHSRLSDSIRIDVVAIMLDRRGEVTEVELVKNTISV